MLPQRTIPHQEGDNIRNYKITALCLCTIIGAGFATGRELMTYFTAYGITGFVTAMISSILFAVVIRKIMTLLEKDIAELLTPYFFGKAVLITTELFLLVLYSAMLSAGGEMLYIIFGFNKILGTIITALTAMLIIRQGSTNVSGLSEVLFIPIVIIIFIISLTTTEKAIGVPSNTTITPRAILSPFIYVSYNMLTAIPLLISIPEKYMYRSCGNQVGMVIFILSTMLMLPLYTHYTAVCDSSLPLMEILEGPTRYLYIFFIGIAIMTTAVSAGYSLCRSTRLLKYEMAVPVFTLAALGVSELGFSNIVNSIYFLFGIVGIVLLGVVMVHRTE